MSDSHAAYTARRALRPGAAVVPRPPARRWPGARGRAGPAVVELPGAPRLGGFTIGVDEPRRMWMLPGCIDDARPLRLDEPTPTIEVELWTCSGCRRERRTPSPPESGQE